VLSQLKVAATRGMTNSFIARKNKFHRKIRADTCDDEEHEYDPRREGGYSLSELEAIAFHIASNAAATRGDTFDGVECVDMDDDAYDLDNEDEDEQEENEDEEEEEQEAEQRSLRSQPEPRQYNDKHVVVDNKRGCKSVVVLQEQHAVHTNSMSSEHECKDRLTSALRKGLKFSVSPPTKRLNDKLRWNDETTPVPKPCPVNLHFEEKSMRNEEASLIPHHYVE